MTLSGWRAQCTVLCIKVLVYAYDILSLPFFFLAHHPWKKWKLDNIVWAKLQDKNDPYSCYVRQIHHLRPEDIVPETMDQLLSSAVMKYGENDCYGVREVLDTEEERSKSGKIVKKLNLGDYKWISFNDVNRRVDDVAKGLLSFGVQSKKPICILAETRIEWLLVAQACFRINVPVVTLYATLGEDGIAHGIRETEVTHIITSSELLPKIKNIAHNIPNVTHIIYMEGKTETATDGDFNNINVLTFTNLEKSGREANISEFSFSSPVTDDLAIIMYTSGSTGTPKGVMITHKNVTNSLKGFADVMSNSSLELKESDTYIAYLPVAHVLELASECYLSLLGIRIGFSSPQTLTDFSPAVKKDQLGDISILKPTLFVTVPLILDRIRKNIVSLAGKEETFSRLMFDFAVKYKKFWSQKGFKTPILDKILLTKYRDFLGGRLRAIVCGSAPLSPDTQTFIQACLGVQVMQAYGLTETAACATVMDFDDHSVGRVGAPLAICRLRLVDWKEGNYFVQDKPNPRGEIVIGGDSLTLGYFKNASQTMETFKIEGGERWFYTGDIGEVYPNGTLKIIDRKKDLVKLQFGEYVALGKIETELKTCPLVENICVYGNGLYSYIVALVTPNQPQLKLLAKELGKETLTIEEMCSDKEITKEVAQSIRDYATKCGLLRSEIPHKVTLCHEDWNPESGLVTAAFKLRRKCVENHYKSAIDNMYKETKERGTNST